jgi:glycyl-tRNA synthetase alpha subunit
MVVVIIIQCLIDDHARAYARWGVAVMGATGLDWEVFVDGNKSLKTSWKSLTK